MNILTHSTSKSSFRLKPSQNIKNINQVFGACIGTMGQKNYLEVDEKKKSNIVSCHSKNQILEPSLIEKKNHSYITLNHLFSECVQQKTLVTFTDNHD